MTSGQGGDAGARILTAIAIGLIVGAGILSVLSTRLLIRQLDQQSVARHQMTLIARLLSALTDAEAAVLQDVYQRALDAQILESKRQARSTTWTVAASSVLALLFGAAAARMTSRDAARRRRAEAALSEERDRLSAIIAAVPYGLVLFDPDANITLRNKAADDLLQLDGNLPVVHARRAAYRMFRTDGRELSPPEWPTRRAVAGKVSVNEELLIARPDGTTVPMIVSAAPIRSSDGSLLGAVAGFQDITHLHEVGRMKNEFVSTVSHELRTPLTSIRGSLQLVLDERGSCSASAHELLAIALTNTGACRGRGARRRRPVRGQRPGPRDSGRQDPSPVRPVPAARTEHHAPRAGQRPGPRHHQGDRRGARRTRGSAFFDGRGLDIYCRDPGRTVPRLETRH
jgi:signal transduction histidine kinase